MNIGIINRQRSGGINGAAHGKGVKKCIIVRKLAAVGEIHNILIKLRMKNCQGSFAVNAASATALIRGLSCIPDCKIRIIVIILPILGIDSVRAVLHDIVFHRNAVENDFCAGSDVKSAARIRCCIQIDTVGRIFEQTEILEKNIARSDIHSAALMRRIAGETAAVRILILIHKRGRVKETAAPIDAAALRSFISKNINIEGTIIDTGGNLSSVVNSAALRGMIVCNLNIDEILDCPAVVQSAAKCRIGISLLINAEPVLIKRDIVY